jgi:hypothetical protein
MKTSHAAFIALGGFVLLVALWKSVPRDQQVSEQTQVAEDPHAKLVREVTAPNYAKIFAELELPKLMRDPDSLVIESVTPFKLGRYQGKEYYVSRVAYRAKNGFGGHNRESATILLDPTLDPEHLTYKLVKD